MKVMFQLLQDTTIKIVYTTIETNRITFVEVTKN